MISRARLVVLAAVLAAIVFSGAAALATDYVVIKVVHRPATELVEAVRALLSPDGTALADARNNTLIIMDNPAVLKQCRDLVDSLDVPARQVRLYITFFEARDRRRVDLDVRWRYNGGGFVIGDFRDGRGGEGLALGAFGSAMAADYSSVTTQDMLVVDGGSGRFVTGTDVPIPNDVFVRYRNGGYIREGVTFREVSTGFVFTPTILETGINLVIAPFFSYMSDRGDGSIVFSEAETTVSIPSGKTVVIGGNETNTGKVVGDIFTGFSATADRGNFYIAVTAVVEK